MAMSARSTTRLRCPACVSSYGLVVPPNAISLPSNGLRQQIRGKKKMANNSATLLVRLLQDVKGYGRSGSIVPVARGAMRNQWFPTKVADYVTMPEMKRLRLAGVEFERDFQYGMEISADEAEASDMNDVKNMSIAELRAASARERELHARVPKMSTEELTDASAFQQAPIVDRLTPERSAELVELFVPRRIDFYRQPIMEEKEDEPVDSRSRAQFGGVTGDLIAARMPRPKPKFQAIYGSVATHDVLVALRAAMGNNDEAARVVLHEDDLQFVDLPNVGGAEASRVKHVGDFSIEIRVRGLDVAVRRTVRVIPQET